MSLFDPSGSKSTSKHFILLQVDWAEQQVLAQKRTSLSWEPRWGLGIAQVDLELRDSDPWESPQSAFGQMESCRPMSLFRRVYIWRLFFGPAAHSHLWAQLLTCFSIGLVAVSPLIKLLIRVCCATSHHSICLVTLPFCLTGKQEKLSSTVGSSHCLGRTPSFFLFFCSEEKPEPMFVPSGEKKNLFFTIALSQMKDIAIIVKMSLKILSYYVDYLT